MATAERALAGTAATHGDLRADNVLVDGDRAVLVDWNFLALGPPWLDLAGLLPAARADGVDADAWVRRSPLLRDADPAAVDTWLAVIGAYMIAIAGKPLARRPPVCGCTSGATPACSSTGWPIAVAGRRDVLRSDDGSQARRVPADRRTTPSRSRERVGYDRAAVHAVLDEALICHLGLVADGEPLVLPTIHARVGDPSTCTAPPARASSGWRRPPAVRSRSA